jgi:hypothetical protein
MQWLHMLQKMWPQLRKNMNMKLLKKISAVLASGLLFATGRSLSLLLAGIVVFLPCVSVSKEPIPVLIYDRPPYYARQADGSFAGLVGTRVAHAFERAGVSFVWSTALLHTHLEKIRDDKRAVCAAGWFKTKEREEYARFTIPVYQDQPLVVVGRTDNTKFWTSTFVALILQPNVKMLAQIDFSFGAEIDRMISASGVTVRRVATVIKQNLKRILLGFEDFLLVSPEELSVAINQVSGSKRLVKRRFQDIPLGNTRHIICSKSVSEDLNRLLDEAISKNR